MSETIPDNIPFEINTLSERYAQELIRIDRVLSLDLVAVAALNDEGIFEINFGEFADIPAMQADLISRRGPLIQHLGLVVTIPTAEQLHARRQVVQELLSDNIASADV